MPKNNKSELKSGEKFNRLTILKFSHSDKRWRKWYLVRCECGKEKAVMGLHRGHLEDFQSSLATLRTTPGTN